MLWAFTKYHALGNDYIVIDPKNLPSPLTTAQVKMICHRNFGIGSDGILLGPLPSKKAEFALRIFNPDGSEAEKSGNGLRIFSRFLWDKKLVRQNEFTVETPGGLVQATVMERGKMVRVEMGRVSFWSDEIPVTGPRREVINEPIQLRGRAIQLLRGDDWQSALCSAAAQNQRGTGEAIRTTAGNASAFSQPHQRAIHESARPE